MRHAVERVLASAMRRARCAPLPVVAALATASMLPGGALPPLLADRPQPRAEAPAVVAAPPTASFLNVLDRASRGEARSTVVPAKKPHTHATKPAHRWVRPSGGPLTSTFGPRWGRTHRGIDLGAGYGAPIYAVTDGVITYAGPKSGYGRLMIIRHWDGSESAYGHMSRFVRTSGRVKAGEVIARVGAAGEATGPHLHFEIRVGGVAVNPRPYLRKRGLYI